MQPKLVAIPGFANSQLGRYEEAFAPTNREGINYFIRFQQLACTYGVLIRSRGFGDPELPYRELLQMRDAIESAVGIPLSWELSRVGSDQGAHRRWLPWPTRRVGANPRQAR